MKSDLRTITVNNTCSGTSLHYRMVENNESVQLAKDLGQYILYDIILKSQL